MSKTVVITGAGGVLCSRLAEALAENGHKIAVLDLRMEAADSVVARIKANGGTAIGVEANVLEKDNLIRAKKKVNNTFGKIDILINGAGGNHPMGTTCLLKVREH